MRRWPKVPLAAASLMHHVSKADLLEAAWHLASLTNEAGSADDDESTFRRLLDELRTLGHLSKSKADALLSPPEVRGHSPQHDQPESRGK